ncbi:MAG: histidinol-phosphate transaminase [Desulfosarcinaceae bacterium]|jgi:histidinol-phosphate aminotransferase
MIKSDLPRIPGIRPSVNHATPYQPGQFIEDVRSTYNLEEVVKIASNENPYGPFPNSIAYMQREVSKLNLYPDSNFTELRAVLGQVHQVSPDCISISHGAEGMLQTIGKCFLQEGDEVILPTATYTLYSEISIIMGADVIRVPMDQYSVNLAEVEAALSERTKLIWLANPNNPTGTIVDRHDFERFLAMLPENTWVVLDEAYAEFAEAEKLPDRVALIKAGHRLISVRTFSKAYGLAGARLGYAIARPDMVSVINTVSEPFNANRVALAGALGVLEKDLQAVRKSTSRIIRERQRTEERLHRLNLDVIPSQANFVMFQTPVDAQTIFEEMLSQGVIVRPCAAWNYPHMVRVTIGTPPQMDRFFALLESLLAKYGE